ncbi:alpha,alpha-trehalase [Nostoc sp. UCD121]|uniref:trehalase family glycosidase n=1 Tax=unclassified Nostoc TaxID=2593658 RepID=UPI00162A34C0|nr:MULTISPECIES: trehalase family glycosidase [unclassified Nostoc]MBC1222196.1 alpha,alpha-trehalase [Nostoc sp. UCD120]MBC1274457.1 alpha,alpha-trehalase [Nostoc sp. UCD121]MBC1295730.1 alpha,alpha-trehalase [Nostoc sp. UCD122]
MTTPPQLSTTQINKVRFHIKKTWKTLTRSHEHLLQSAKDTKLDHKTDTPWIVYISPLEDCPTIQRVLERSLYPKDMQQLQIRTLPSEVEAIKEHGLLYLPGPYVVPGGRFNEMYGWDSYFILLGLLHDEEWDLAQSQVDQLLYQVKHYGTILNANRTYMLSRSQPPVLSMMVLALFQHTQDEEWLRTTVPLLEQFYYYWVVPPHLNPGTGLSRFYAFGEGPAPEVVFSERDEEGKSHYDRVKEYYQTFEIEDYDVNLYYDRENDKLTHLFYKADRTMRESGFDITNRFGPFSADILHYAPVCLNSLLYQVEQDLAQINAILGNEQLEKQWRDRGEYRRDRIDQFLWNEERGLYCDYHFQSGKRRCYEFATTFYPLWLGIASQAQAQRVVENLSLFEAPGGILTSTHVTGNQWDAPFGWAPLTLIAVQGLHRYGFHTEGDRIANKFLAMVIKEFERHNTLVEKYDVERCSANVSDEISFGYSSNEVGFGWTNGVILELLAARGKKV